MIDLSTALPYTDQVVVSLTILFIAGLIQGIFGMGFAMIATPMLGLFLDYRVAVILAAVPLWFIATRYILQRRHYVRESQVTRSLLPGIMIGSLAGVVLYGLLPVGANYALLGVLLLVSAFVPLALRHLRWIGRDTSIRGSKPLGFLAGVTESLMNVGAPFILLFSGISNLKRRQQMLALNLCFAVGKSIQIVLITLFIPVSVSWVHVGLAVICSTIGFQFGDRFGGQWSEVQFRRGLFIFLLIMAVAMGLRALTVATQP